MEKLNLSEKQQKIVEKFKKQSYYKRVENKHCVICPSKEPCEDYYHSFYCPLLNEMICECCCHFDMEADDWPRGEDETICDGCYEMKRLKKVNNANK